MTLPMGADPRHGGIDLRRLPAGATFLRILGVNYAHVMTEDEGELYLTQYGVPLYDHLRPDNWYDDDWFKANRVRLEGTSTVYRVATQPIAGRLKPTIDLVVKWSRVGEDVPINTYTLQQAIDAEFNSPFEEFSLLQELRAGRYGDPDVHILTQKPLAIYVPPETMQQWQTGRSTHRILRKLARHPGIEIDILREYILIYGWIRGVDAVGGYGGHGATEQRTRLASLTHHVNDELHRKGFTVADNKPAHFIVRPTATGPRRHRDERILYALIDYELLARTPEHDQAVRDISRSRYLARQRDRFCDDPPRQFNDDLHPVEVLGLPWVYGRCESTSGALWVLGRDPDLFDYFLPERWRTSRVALSRRNRTFYTQTKDRIHLVWRISHVGEIPPGTMGDPEYRKVLLAGYNAPFEEIELAMAMQRAGLKTTYPRAVYKTRRLDEWSGQVLDDRRFERFADLRTPDGQPAMPMDHDYVTIWGYFRGLEDEEASIDSGYWTPIDAQRMREKGLISQETIEALLACHRQRLAQAGFEDLGLCGSHLLLSYVPPGTIKRDPSGQIEVRQCNFELVRRI